MSLEWPKGTFLLAIWNHTLDKWDRLGKREVDKYWMKEM